MCDSEQQEIAMPLDDSLADQGNPPENDHGNDERRESKGGVDSGTSNPPDSQDLKDATIDDATTEDGNGKDATTDDATTKDASGEDATSKDASGEDATTDDATTKDASGEDATTDDATTKDASGEDATTDDATTKDASGEDATSKDATTDDTTTKDASGEDATPKDATTDDATTKDASSEDATPKDATTDDATTKDASSEDATPKDATSKDATTNDATSKDATPKDAIPKDAIPNDDWADIFGTGELKMKTVRRGKRNTKPQPSDMCDVRLIGKLENGKLVEKYDLLRVQIGDHEVVQGLELILPLMNVGEKALVIVAPRFGYGVHGNPPNIPPNATLKYVIELFNIEIQTPLENIPHDKRMTLATAKRERGNWWYSRQDTNKSVQCYKKAADLLDETIAYVDPKGRVIENTRAKKRIVVQEKIKVYNNLAAAQLKMDAYDSALDSVLVVLQHEPNNVKALFRKAKILSAKGRVSDAIIPLRQACLLEPKNTAVLSEINRCMRILEIERRDERILCRKMFGHLDHSDEEPSPMQELMQPEGKSLIWQKLLKTAVTATIMAAVAAALGYKFKNYPFL